MNKSERWLQWAIELQSLAQAGLAYGKDAYDKERYERIREISADIISHMSDIPTETVKICFAMKQDTRHQNSIPVLPYSKMIKFFLSVKTMELGHCLVVGVMLMFLLGKTP